MGFFSRFGRLLSGFLGISISGIERRNPCALLQVAKNEFAARRVEANKGLVSVSALISRLQIQIKDGERRIKEITARILANNTAGNKEIAGTLALQLQELRTDLEHNKAENGGCGRNLLNAFTSN